MNLMKFNEEKLDLFVEKVDAANEAISNFKLKLYMVKILVNIKKL